MITAAKGLPAGQWLMLLLCLVALPLANSLALPILRRRLGGSFGRSAWWYHRVALVIAHTVLIGGVAFVTRKDGWRRLGISATSALWLLLLVVGLMVASGFAVAGRNYGGISSPGIGPVTKNENWFAVLSIGWAGVGQELLFRSFAIPAVEVVSGSTFLAVLICAFTFAYYHGGFALGMASFTGNLVGGLLFGVLFIATDSLLAAAIPHALFVASSFTFEGVRTPVPSERITIEE